MFCIVPLQTYLYRRDRLKHGTNRPEARFLTSLVGVWGFPVSLLWFAFTDDGYVLAPNTAPNVTRVACLEWPKGLVDHLLSLSDRESS